MRNEDEMPTLMRDDDLRHVAEMVREYFVHTGEAKPATTQPEPSNGWSRGELPEAEEGKLLLTRVCHDHRKPRSAVIAWVAAFNGWFRHLGVDGVHDAEGAGEHHKADKGSCIEWRLIDLEPAPESDIVRGEALVRSLAVELDLGEETTGGAMVERIRDLAQSRETLEELMHRQGIATEAYDGHEAAHAELRRRWGQDCIGGLDCMETWRKALRMPGASLPDLQDRVESLLYKEQIADVYENGPTVEERIADAVRAVLGMPRATISELRRRLEELLTAEQRAKVLERALGAAKESVRHV